MREQKVPNLIALDWGTSSFRAFLLDHNGAILRRTSTNAGILKIENRKFAQTLGKQLAALGEIPPGTPLLASGMITSRQGWLETEYVECPAACPDLAAHLKPLDTEEFGRIWFIPGVKQLLPTPDIMRGEETQLAGLAGTGIHTVLLPGTHSKWAKLQNGTIKGFTTFMTGDLFSAVRNHTILRAMIQGNWTETGFTAGVHEGFRQEQNSKGLLSTLFQTRVKSILGLSSHAEDECYLSGILIGTEIAEALQTGYTTEKPIIVAGEEKLTQLYLLALKALGQQGEAASPDISARGLYTIARLKQLI